MKKDLTELVFILDRSGSMSGLESDTIGGFNSIIKKQKKENGEVRLTTVLFDDQYELLHDRLDLLGVSPITEEDYYVRGMTALLDAIGKTIHKIGNVQKHTHVDLRAEQVLFVITTDGMENASRQYSAKKIKNMIKRQKEKYGWEFLFLGANIDAVETASSFGIESKHATNYHADEDGLKCCYDSLEATISEFRTHKTISSDWKQSIEKDYKSRG